MPSGTELLAALLEVAVGAAFLHGVDGAHAAVDFVGAALIKNGFARAFLGAGEERADHDGMSADYKGLDDVAGELDAAVGNAAAIQFLGPARLPSMMAVT